MLFESFGKKAKKICSEVSLENKELSGKQL